LSAGAPHAVLASTFGSAKAILRTASKLIVLLGMIIGRSRKLFQALANSIFPVSKSEERLERAFQDNWRNIQFSLKISICRSKQVLACSRQLPFTNADCG